MPLDGTLKTLIEEEYASRRDAILDVSEKARERPDNPITWAHYPEITILPEYDAFYVWESLRGGWHWRASSKIISMYKNGLSLNNEVELMDIINTQMIDAETDACKYPTISRLWTEYALEAPFDRLVTQEHISKGINGSFWKLLGSSLSFVNEGRVQEINKILTYDHLFMSFDFNAGVEEAVNLPENIKLQGLNLIPYLRWMTQMGEMISYKLDDEKEAVNTIGKLAAPIVDLAFSPSFIWNDEHKYVRGLMNAYVRGNILFTPSVQKVIGEWFSFYLEQHYTNGDDSSIETLGVLERVCQEKSEIIEKVWNDVDYKVQDISGIISSYLPEGYFDAEITSLKKELLSLDKFDPSKISMWNKLVTGKNLSRGADARVQNHTADLYFSSKKRPLKDELPEVARGLRSNKYSMKIKAYLFMDFLRKGCAVEANDILHSVHTDYKTERDFNHNVSAYVKEHKPVKVPAKSLLDKVCYPKYNLIPNFVERHPDYVISP